MIAARTLAIVLASASVAAVSAAHAVPQVLGPSERLPRLMLIRSNMGGGLSAAPSIGCGSSRAARIAASQSFVRGPGIAVQSPDANVGDGSETPSPEPSSIPRPFLRIIPRVGFF